VDKAPKSFRFAGDIFGTDRIDKARKSLDESRRRLQASRPVGVGFGTEDKYGPDENWDTRDPIEHTPAPGYYKSYKKFLICSSWFNTGGIYKTNPNTLLVRIGFSSLFFLQDFLGCSLSNANREINS